MSHVPVSIPANEKKCAGWVYKTRVICYNRPMQDTKLQCSELPTDDLDFYDPIVSSDRAVRPTNGRSGRYLRVGDDRKGRCSGTGPRNEDAITSMCPSSPKAGLISTITERSQL